MLGYAPRDIVGHLRGAQASVRRSFPEMRGSIREFLLGQKGVSAYVPHAPAALMSSSSTHAPMDVGAVNMEQCVHCKKSGHSPADCWFNPTRAKAPGKSGGKAGGKGGKLFLGSATTVRRLAT